MRNMIEDDEHNGLPAPPPVVQSEPSPQETKSAVVEMDSEGGHYISPRGPELPSNCAEEKCPNNDWGAWITQLNPKPVQSSKLPFAPPVIKSSNSKESYQGPSPRRYGDSDGLVTLPAPVSSSSVVNKSSSLHAFAAIACEITETDSSMHRGSRFERIQESNRTEQKSKVKQATLSISQDSTRPYSNLANEWVLSKRQANETTSSTDICSSNASSISINDVLCGRGGMTNHHAGNIFFRKLVRHHQESYLLASKRDKAGVAKSIVENIRNLKPPGRFLKKSRDIGPNGVWEEIGDRKAREKTSQALRERAPELREELECHGRQLQSPPFSTHEAGSKEQNAKYDDFHRQSLPQKQQQHAPKLKNTVRYVRQISCDTPYPSSDNVPIVHPNSNNHCVSYPLDDDQTIESANKRQKVQKMTSINSTPLPCSFQAQAGIRIISSSESEDLFEVQDMGAGNRQECEIDTHDRQKNNHGGPRIKMIKDRVQNVV